MLPCEILYPHTTRSDSVFKRSSGWHSLLQYARFRAPPSDSFEPYPTDPRVRPSQVDRIHAPARADHPLTLSRFCSRYRWVVSIRYRTDTRHSTTSTLQCLFRRSTRICLRGFPMCSVGEIRPARPIVIRRLTMFTAIYEVRVRVLCH